MSAPLSAIDIDPAVTGDRRLLLLVLADWAHIVEYENPPDGIEWYDISPTYEVVTRATTLDQPEIDAALAGLVEHGYLTVVDARTGAGPLNMNGRATVGWYRLVLPERRYEWGGAA